MHHMGLTMIFPKMVCENLKENEEILNKIYNHQHHNKIRECRDNKEKIYNHSLAAAKWFYFQ